MAAATSLRVYRFDAAASLEGEIVRVLEDGEVAGHGAIVDALFVTRAEDGVHAIDLATGRADGTIATLLDFRLDPGSRPAATERTLAPHEGGVPATVVETIAASLPAGGAVLAALVTGEMAQALDDAMTVSGGRVAAGTPVEATTLADAAPQLCAAL